MITKAQIEEYLEHKQKLAYFKDLEGSHRRVLCAEVLGQKVKGVAHLIVEDLDLAATAKVNLSVDADLLKGLWKDLAPEERAVIKFKPEINGTLYNKLPADSKLKRLVTVKPGMPSLEIKPCKIK